MRHLAEQLAKSIGNIGGGELLIVTGAGISRASGIPTFRGSESGAIWKTSDVTLATRDCLERDPAAQWRWYLSRFRAVRDAQPNPAHLALVELADLLEARGCALQLVTQNIDTLHEQAGSRDLIKVHGTSDRVRCSRNGCPLGSPTGSLPLRRSDFAAFAASPTAENLPRCPRCDSILRAHVLFFDEYYLEHQDYRFAEVERLADTARLMLFVGTSFSVGVTDLYLRSGHARGVEMWSIDPGVDAPAFPGLKPIPAPAEQILPICCELLQKQAAGGTHRA